MKKIIIHGGIHRTGTTSLQNAFAGNRERLNEAGISYPGKQRNHQSWAWDQLSGRTTSDSIATAIDRNIYDTIILSAEDFCRFRDLDWLKEVRSRHFVSVHFFVRRQDEWLTSWYNQNIRWPFDKRTATLTASEFLGTLDSYYWLDFNWLGDLWADVVGRENVNMHVLGGDTISRFREICAPQITFEEFPLPNDSAPPDAIEFLRHLDLLSMNPKQRQKVVAAARAVFKDTNVSKNIYSKDVRNDIIEKYRQNNELAFAKYVRGPVKNFDYTMSDSSHYEPQLPDSEALLRDVVTPMMKLITQ